MIVMPANNGGLTLGRMTAFYPGRLGHLLSPKSKSGPHPWLPYALDNGAFPAWKNGEPWDEMEWLKLIEWAAAQVIQPMWVLCPDVVADRKGTLLAWEKYHSRVAELGRPIAFAVQDGMTAADVPGEAAVVFVGGSFEWKWESLGYWCAHFPRVHVGRVNTYRWLRVAEAAGAESCDGTGWFQGRKAQLMELIQWLQEVDGIRDRIPQGSLFESWSIPTGTVFPSGETGEIDPSADLNGGPETETPSMEHTTDMGSNYCPQQPPRKATP